MRLWHYKLIPYLPKSQLLAQWRELNSIFKKQDHHILINYIYEYPPYDLWVYSWIVIDEMAKRGFKISEKSITNMCEWSLKDKEDKARDINGPFEKHHNDRYLIQCFYNLQEKYDRGQKDFSKEQYQDLDNFVQSQFYWTNFIEDEDNKED